MRIRLRITATAAFSNDMMTAAAWKAWEARIPLMIPKLSTGPWEGFVVIDALLGSQGASVS